MGNWDLKGEGHYKGAKRPVGREWEVGQTGANYSSMIANMGDKGEVKTPVITAQGG